MFLVATSTLKSKRANKRSMQKRVQTGAGMNT